MDSIVVKEANNSEDYKNRNMVHLCGKLVSKKRLQRDTLMMMVSCERKGTLNKDGEKVYRLIRVMFYDDAAEFYDNRFEVGDFVTVNGIAQLIRNHYTGTSAVSIWGITMGPKYVDGRMIPDHNQVAILGKIDSAVALTKDYILLNVKTVVQKERKFLGQTKEASSITKEYTSVTPIGLRCNGNASELIKQFTVGTHVNIVGFVDSRRMKIDETHTHIVNRVICNHIEIIGQSQPAAR